MVGLIVVGVQIAVARSRKPVIAAVVTAGVIGGLLENAMVAGGLVSYGAPWPALGLAPVWLVALWMVFGTCIEATDRMLGRHALSLGALLGAILAPLTYWFGARFGALAFAEPLWLPLAATALAWAVATPLMILAARSWARC